MWYLADDVSAIVHNVSTLRVAMFQLGKSSHILSVRFYFYFISLIYYFCSIPHCCNVTQWLCLQTRNTWKVWIYHDDVIKWKLFRATGSTSLAFVRGIHRGPGNSPRKGLWRRALMVSLISSWINGWVKNCEASDLRRHRTHYDVIVMMKYKLLIHVTQTTCESLLIICYLKVLLKYSIMSNATIHLMVYIIMKRNYML